MATFNVLTDLPQTMQDEIARIQAKNAALRTTLEANLLTARAPYLTNEIIDKDVNGLILRAAGYTLPTGLTGFKKGALFTDKDASTNALYENVGDETSATWEAIGGSGVVAEAPTDSVVATAVLTSNNTNVTAGKKVTIGTKVYTFRSALTTDPATIANEVLIGASADASLTNLRAAINASGTAGTSYSVGTVAHTLVTCGAVASHTVTLTAKVFGEAANAIATTTDETTLSWGAEVLENGADGTTGRVTEMTTDGSYLYVCVTVSATTGYAWKRVQLASLS